MSRERGGTNKRIKKLKGVEKKKKGEGRGKGSEKDEGGNGQKVKMREWERRGK